MEKFEIVKAKDDFTKRLDAIKKVIDYGQSSNFSYYL